MCLGSGKRREVIRPRGGRTLQKVVVSDTILTIFLYEDNVASYVIESVLTSDGVMESLPLKYLGLAEFLLQIMAVVREKKYTESAFISGSLRCIS